MPPPPQGLTLPISGGSEDSTGFSPPNTLSGDTISAIQQDQAGILWIGTGGFGLPGHGLNRLDPQIGAVTRDDPKSLSSDDVVSLYLDPNNTLWVGTWGGGVNQLNINSPSRQFVHHRHDPLNPAGLSWSTSRGCGGWAQSMAG